MFINSILSTKLHYRWLFQADGWKIEYLANKFWPWTLTFHLNCFKRIFVYKLMSILPTKFHYHWTFLAQVMAGKCNFWPKVQWPLTRSKFVQKLISSSTPHVVSLSQVWIKSIQRLILWLVLTRSTCRGTDGWTDNPKTCLQHSSGWRHKNIGFLINFTF